MPRSRPLLDGVQEEIAGCEGALRANLKWLMDRRDLTPRELAPLAGFYDQKGVYNILNGATNPRFGYLVGLATVLDVRPHELLLPHEEMKQVITEREGENPAPFVLSVLSSGQSSDSRSKSRKRSSSGANREDASQQQPTPGNTGDTLAYLNSLARPA